MLIDTMIDDFDDRPEDAKRLETARKRAGFDSALSAAKAHGWNSSTYGAHENGRNGYKDSAAKKYAEAFGVRWQWLRTGEGSMTEPGMQNVVPMQPPQPQYATPNAGASIPVGGIPRGVIPVLGRAAAGEPGKIILLDGDPTEWIPCPAELIGVEGAYSTYVDGDSMEDRYYHGERVYVHPSRPPGPKDFVVAQVRDENDNLCGYIKQYKSFDEDGLHLKQFNPRSDLNFDAEKVEHVHVIVGSGRG